MTRKNECIRKKKRWTALRREKNEDFVVEVGTGSVRHEKRKIENAKEKENMTEKGKIQVIK